MKLEYLERDIQTLVEEKRIETIKLNEYKSQLPNPLPSLGDYAQKNLDELQIDISSLNSKLESLEPVNMLALEELEELELEAGPAREGNFLGVLDRY